MTLHSTLTGTALHFPLGRSPYPLSVPNNTAQAYLIRDADDNELLLLITTTGAQYIQLGNTTTNPTVLISTASGARSLGPVEIDQYPLVLKTMADPPAAVAYKGKLYTKDVGGVVELFYIDDAGNITQISSGGKLIPRLSTAPSNGDTLTYNSGTGLWVPTATGWSTAYEVDFTAQSSQTLSDGTRTIDGKAWTAANNSHANTFALTNGTGIVINPKGDSANRYDGGDRTLPILTVPMATLWPSFNAALHRLRLSFLFDTANQFANGNYQGWLGGLEPPSAVANRHYMACTARRDFGSSFVTHMRQSVWYQTSMGTQVSQGVAMLEVHPYSWMRGYWLTHAGADWPAASAVEAAAVGELACLPWSQSDTSPMLYGNSANVFFGAYGWNYAGFTLTVKKLKVEYQEAQ